MTSLLSAVMPEWFHPTVKKVGYGMKSSCTAVGEMISSRRGQCAEIPLRVYLHK